MGIKRKLSVSLSEQNLVDCVAGDNCNNGGSQEDAFTYIKSNGGIASESSYPYKGVDGTCK